MAILSFKVGLQYLEVVEDAVQSALMAALETWMAAGLPDNPSAWLFQVARNKVIDELRKDSRRRRILEQSTQAAAHFAQGDESDGDVSGDVGDDLLRMLFVCCDEAISVESQLVLALKILCGFDVREIAFRLFISEANVYKRLSRAREQLRRQSIQPGELTDRQYQSRVPSVHRILYLLFTEGFLSTRPESTIRLELCQEALRLTDLLADHPTGQVPETFALLALMHFHLARSAARLDSSGGLLLLEEQDRGLWDEREIQTGLEWLAKSAYGSRFSRYHAEAGIAAEHCLAPSFRETRWDKVAANYEILEQIAPSALHRLNRAVALAEWKDPAAGLAVLTGFEPPAWLAGSYLWSAVLADLYRRSGQIVMAAQYREKALTLAPTQAIRDLLLRRLVVPTGPTGN